MIRRRRKTKSVVGTGKSASKPVSDIRWLFLLCYQNITLLRFPVPWISAW